MLASTTGSWSWFNDLLVGDRATISVGSSDVYTIDVAMAQDGMVLDKVVLTTDADFVPTGLGPPESLRDELPPAAIEPPVETVPAAYGLEPSYPNPFTGVTTIPFAAPGDGAVRVDVYDLLGRRVATLVDEVVTAGSHEVYWNASDLPSGMYFVRLTAQTFVATKRMSLIR